VFPAQQRAQDDVASELRAQLLSVLLRRLTGLQYERREDKETVSKIDLV
jgi:hypothetical protein